MGSLADRRDTTMAVSSRDIEALVSLVQRNNSFFSEESSAADSGNIIPFFVGALAVGLVKKEFLPFLADFTECFEVFEDVRPSSGKFMPAIRLKMSLSTVHDRTEALRKSMEALRQYASDLVALKGWRNEDYSVYCKFQDGPLFHMERAATCLLGVRRYGVHVNGYVVDKNSGDIRLWIGQRANNKPTYPGQLDNMSAGGLTAGLGIVEAAKKELKEEASIPDALMTSSSLRSVGTISYCFEDARGILPEQLFIFDLELPPDFVPVNSDGEVASFSLHSISDALKLIQQPNFKPNSAMVTLDFFIRHGFLTPDHTPYYSYLVQSMHVDPMAHLTPFVPSIPRSLQFRIN